METGKPLLVVLGALLGLVGMGLLAAGITVSWVHASQRDADGFYTSPTYELASEGHAITTEQVHLAVHPGDWFPAPGELTVRVDVMPAATDRPVFVGVASPGEVEAFLDGAAHSQLARLGTEAQDVTYRNEPGALTPGPPGDHDLWLASVEGTGPQVLLVDAVPGEWTLVVMNADATPGVEVAASAGVRSDLLLLVGVGLLLTAIVLLGGAVALLVIGTGRRQDDVPALPQSDPRVGSIGEGGERRELTHT